MKSTTHFTMAHIMFASLQKRGIYLNRIAFVYGNIAPDYSPSMLVAPHFNKVCYSVIKELSLSLPQLPLDASGYVGVEYSRQLGVLCHFLCDYFCAAHDKGFTRGIGIRRHMDYEDALHEYLRHNCLELLEVYNRSDVKLIETPKLLLAETKKCKQKYSAVERNFENDICFSLDICIAAIVSIVAMSQQIAAPTIQMQVDDFMTSMKRFANGNGLIYRMFFFRNRHNDTFFLPELIPPIKT